MSLRGKAFIMKGYKLLYFLIILVTYSVFMILGHSKLQLEILGQDILVYSVFLITLTRVYGNLDFGNIKTRMLVKTTSLGVVFSDILGFVFLGIIACLNAPGVFQVQSLFFLVIVIIFHIVITRVLIMIGDRIFLRLYAPINTLIIVDNESVNEDKIMKCIRGNTKRYNLLDIFLMKDDQLPQILLEADFCVINVSDHSLRSKIVSRCFDLEIKYTIVPNLEDILLQNVKPSVIDDVTIFESKEIMTSSQRTLKRLCDVVISFCFLIITLPIMLIISIAIKLDDGGSVFFRQKRMTKDREVFDVIKFRSMKENVANYSSVANDDRITKVGNFLRKTRLDELPQFINVLIGDMSIVGPRPEMIENVEKYEMDFPEFSYRLKVKAGITGIAQIEGKYNSSPKDKLFMDLVYIQNYSFFNDIRLMLLTLTVIAKEDSTEGFNNHE
uniref:Sugar transferase n=1 Tax=Erysipelothrix rhusiopathiae TaxID=1648 RepID=A0A6S6I646_ERYRH|nr:sugar transferase [Erysipelothrix rhusiopathiae]